MAQVRLILILLVVGALLFFAAKSQLGASTVQIALVTDTDVAVTGTFEVLDEKQAVVGSTEIGDQGSKCGGGRLSHFKVKAKNAKEYWFRYNGLTAGPLDGSKVKSAGHNVTVNSNSRGLEATIDRPRSCL